MLGMAAQRCHPKPWLQSFLEQGISKGKKEKKIQHIKTHGDDGEQVPNSLINFKAQRWPPQKIKSFPQTPLPSPFTGSPSQALCFSLTGDMRETQILWTQLPAPRKNKEEQQKMANVKRLQQWRLKHGPALSPKREKEIVLWEDGNSSFYKHGCN